MTSNNKLFFVDSSEGIEITYSQFLHHISTTTSVDYICKHHNYYDIFKHIVTSMLAGYPITLLDGDLTYTEVQSLVDTDDEIINASATVDLSHIHTQNQLLEELKKTSSKWSITLYTSGTTGRPKSVTHSLESITRNVHTSEKHSNDVWGFAYNPTHMAGLQVFFQALFNTNTIVRIFEHSKDSIIADINSLGITHISATPTFYRLLLPCNNVFPHVIRLTSGGEKFDSNTLMQLQECFPNAKLTNVYASTEAGTLFASKGNDFVLKSDMQKLVKIVDGELFIHNSLLGQSLSFSLVDGWYNTGDLVEVVKESPLTIRFKSRKSELINVGGYKVNPIEVEDTIRLIPLVKDVRVFAKDNRVLGKIICCEIVVQSENELNEATIRHFLQTHLQEYKIPRLFKFVDHLSITHTGKISRL